MIINLHFGYAARHHIYYDTEHKRGTIKLWSSYSGPILGNDPTQAREGLPAELLAQQGVQTEARFRVNQQTEFLITDEKDILGVLASLAAVRNGSEFAFTTKEGRKITLSLKKGGKREKDVITVKLQYGQAGRLTVGEAHKLQTIARDILHDLGHTDQEISEGVESIGQTCDMEERKSL